MARAPALRIQLSSLSAKHALIACAKSRSRFGRRGSGAGVARARGVREPRQSGEAGLAWTPPRPRADGTGRLPWICTYKNAIAPGRHSARFSQGAFRLTLEAGWHRGYTQECLGEPRLDPA